MTTRNKVTVIGISGKTGSGKTTLAAEFKRVLVDRAVETNFADALKAEVASRYSIEKWRCYSQDEKNKPISAENPLTIGQALQKVGNERRQQDADYWLNKVAELVADLGDNVDVVVVGDVRFRNEADWIKQAGGVLVRLNGDPGAVRQNSKRDLTHSSETDLDAYERFDFVFDTDKTAAATICTLVLGSLEK